MILLAVDLYGILPFEQAKRIMFKPGLNAIVGNNGAGKTMIYQVLSALLFNAPSQEIAFFKDQNQQAAVTFRTLDGGIYRIARDFKKNMWNLSKKEAAGNKFTSLESEHQKIATWLKTTTGGLDERERRLLFSIDPLRLPSRQAWREDRGKLPEMFAPTDTTASPQDTGISQHAQPESDTLRAEKEQALKDAQQKLDALAEIDDEMLEKRDQIAEIQKRISEVGEIQDKIKRMNAAETEKFSHFSLKDLINSKQIQAFEADEKALAADFDTFEMEGQGLEAALILKKQEGQKKDPVLMIGLLLIVVSFLLPFVIPLSGPLRYIFLGGALSGSGLSGFAYFKRMKRAAAQNNLEKKLLHLDERVRKSEQQFEKKHAAIYKMFKKTASKDLSELKTQQNTYTNLRQKKEAAQARIDEILDKETPEALAEKAKHLQSAFEALQEQLENHQTLSEEVYRLQEALRDSEAKIDMPDNTFSEFPDLDGSKQTGESSFCSALLEIGENGAKPSAKDLEDKAGILFRRFQPQNVAAIQVGANGEITLGERPLHQMSPGLADQVFLSLALASLSRFTKITFPLFLDAPFETLDPASREAAIKILQVIAKRRQVILFATHPEFTQAKHVVALGAMARQA